ncbi:MAG: GNAT family N-acetyltransferase [Planctomycetes bacterium]|nr:GNAT family N-acetyltransferase [Planctomycetota bacterium]
MEVTNIKKQHLKDVVKIHMQSFPSFFLTFLGPRFLKEFYGSFIYDQQGIGFVAIENGKVFGVVVGPLDTAGYFKRLLLKKWYAFCFASIGAVLRKPTVIKRLLRAVFYRGEAPQDKKRSLLSSIAVSPEAQRKSIGKTLVLKWLEEIKSRGARGAFLTTDAKDNETVNGFYQSLGWKIESSYVTPEGRLMNRYVFDFER